MNLQLEYILINAFFAKEVETMLNHQRIINDSQAYSAFELLYDILNFKG
jgi:hypothetical protein